MTTSYQRPNRFYRQRKDKWIAGICSGLAAHFDVPIILVRIIFLLLLSATGIAPILFAYTLATFITEYRDKAGMLEQVEQNAKTDHSLTKRKLADIEIKLEKLESFLVSKTYEIERKFREL